MCAVHLQSQGQKLSPSGMPGTRTVAGTNNCSEGEIPPPVPPLIRALDVISPYLYRIELNELTSSFIVSRLDCVTVATTQSAEHSFLVQYQQNLRRLGTGRTRATFNKITLSH